MWDRGGAGTAVTGRAAFFDEGNRLMDKNIRIILASASPRRLELLRQVGLTPEVVPSRVDESGVGGTPEQMVTELSRRKAEDVAARIGRTSAAVVIGADTVVAVNAPRAGEGRSRAADDVPCSQTIGEPENVADEQSHASGAFAGQILGKPENMGEGPGHDAVDVWEEQILGKPKNAEEAAVMIALLAGRTHRVCTGVTMIFLPSGERVTFAESTEVEVYPMTKEQIGRYVATGEPMDKAGAYGIQGYFAAYVKGIRGDYNNVVGLPVARVYQELSSRVAGL